MCLLTCLLSLCLAGGSVPSPRVPITPGHPAAASVRSEPVVVRRARGLKVAGAVVLMSSGFPWGFVLGGLALGAQNRRGHDRFVAEVNAADRPLTASDHEQVAFYDANGSRANAGAIAGAVVGAALTILGAALFARGLALTRRHARFARRASRGATF